MLNKILIDNNDHVEEEIKMKKSHDNIIKKIQDDETLKSMTTNQLNKLFHKSKELSNNYIIRRNKKGDIMIVLDRWKKIKEKKNDIEYNQKLILSLIDLVITKLNIDEDEIKEVITKIH